MRRQFESQMNACSYAITFRNSFKKNNMYIGL